MIVTTFLMSAALAQGSEPRLLTPAMPGSADVAAFAWMPDGQRAAFLVDRDVDEQFELYRVRIDGSSAPVRINEPLPVGASVQPFFLHTELGDRTVYRADQETTDVIELFRHQPPLDPLGRANRPLPGGVLTRQL